MFVVRRRGSRNIDRIQYEMEDVFHSLLTTGRPVRVHITHGDQPAWRPPIEVYETDTALVITAEIAGMTEEQIEVVIDENVVTIRGERLPVGCDERRTVHAMGISYGPFAADVYLPFSVDFDRVEASYEAGMLRVELPRAAATRISIGSSQ
jgi:HSP20 family protein